MTVEYSGYASAIKEDIPYSTVVGWKRDNTLYSYPDEYGKASMMTSRIYCGPKSTSTVSKIRFRLSSYEDIATKKVRLWISYRANEPALKRQPSIPVPQIHQAHPNDLVLPPTIGTTASFRISVTPNLNDIGETDFDSPWLRMTAFRSSIESTKYSKSGFLTYRHTSQGRD